MRPEFVTSDVRRMSPVTLGVVVLGHVGVMVALASARVNAVSMPETTLLVDVIQSASEKAKEPETTPPKAPTKLSKATHQVNRPLPAIAPPVLATTRATAPAMADVPAVVAAPVPAPALAAQVPPAPASPAPAIHVAPRFDADYLDNPAPAYPSLARRSGEQGKVILRVFVEPSGLPSRVELRTSSGFERLDKSAITAVGRWKFIPARQGTEAVGAWVLVPILFSLKA